MSVVHYVMYVTQLFLFNENLKHSLNRMEEYYGLLKFETSINESETKIIRILFYTVCHGSALASYFRVLHFF